MVESETATGPATGPINGRRLQASDVSIIVPAHAVHDAFVACLAGLKTLSPPAGEVLIAVDGDDAEAAAAVARLTEAAGFRALSSPGRTGPAAARNRGAGVAMGSVLFFVDSDLVVPSDAVDRLCVTWDRDPEAAAVFGSYDDQPADPGFVSQFTNLMHHHVHQNSGVEASTFWAGCGAVRTDWFHRVGGFDEAYDRPAIEDIELGYRLRAAGGRIIVDKSLQAKHLKRWTLLSMVRTHIRDRAWPWTQLIVQRGQLDDNLNTDRKSRMAGLTAVLVVVALGLAFVNPWALVVAVGLVAVLVHLEWNLYRFFCRRRGLPFALGALLLHGCYLVYSSLTFGLGVVVHRLKRMAGGALS